MSHASRMLQKKYKRAKKQKLCCMCSRYHTKRKYGSSIAYVREHCPYIGLVAKR